MIVLATPLVEWDNVLKILLAGLIGAVGVVVLYGFLLLAVSRARTSKSEGVRIVEYAIAGVCGFLCIAAVVIGIYAMVNKPKSSSSKSKGKAKIAMVAAPPRRTGW
jgi:NADH:ubiquinone oxidoreductase subunit 6 (subunit J)